MDDFRIGSIPPSDPVRRQPNEDSGNRKRRPHQHEETAETEDVVSLSEGNEEEPIDPGYSPKPNQP